MAIIGLTLGAEREHVSKYDKKAEGVEPTKWVIGSIDSRILGMLQDKATTVKVNTAAPEEQVDTQINGKAFNFECCQFGLKGWSNFKDDKGNDIAFKTIKLNRGGKSYDVISPDALSRVPGVVIDELAEEIMKDNQLSAESGKA